MEKTLNKSTIQNIVLLFISLVVLVMWDWYAAMLLFMITAWTYSFGRVSTISRNRHMTILKIIGITGPIATLVYFKYANFFLDSVRPFLHFKSTLRLILPLGISFFTFQSLGYLFDTYRGKIEPEHDFISFACFMCFFPQIIAGPIGRADELLPQYKVQRHFDESLAVEACRQILWGAFAKFVVADNCAMIGSTLLGCKTLTSVMTVIGTLAITIQIYADFSGYSNMAVGLGKICGIHLRQNFTFPYFAQSFGDFWHRWHISLTTWFRDYVYFPLGGSRCSFVKTLRNTWIVFLLSGLWHGAAWTFVAWGGLHALLLSVEILNKHRNKTRQKEKVDNGNQYRGGDSCSRKFISCLNRLIILIMVSIAWLLFFAPSFSEAGRWLVSLCHFNNNAIWPRIPMSVYAIALISSGILFTTEYVHRDSEFGLSTLKLNVFLRWSVYVTLALLIICCHGVNGNFIYQKF